MAVHYNNKVHGQSRSRVLRFPGSGIWVPCGHSLIFVAAQVWHGISWELVLGHSLEQTCMADGSLLQILARMVVLIWHWYNSSAGDGSLVLMGVALSASKVSCGSAPLYLTHWTACLMDLTHASANPLDCG